MAQEPRHCGAAALGQVLAYHQLPFSEADLRQALFVPVLGGTTPELIIDAAEKKGLQALRCSGQLEDLHEELAAGRPVIALWGGGPEAIEGHFVVVTGYNGRSKRIRIHDGQHADRWMDFASFEKRWKTADHTLIRLLPLIF